MYFKQLELGPMQNFVYLLGDPATREAAVVDPGWEVERIFSQLQADGYQLKHIIITHGHPDHTLGIEPLLRRVDVPVHVHRDEALFLPVEPSAVVPFGDGDRIEVGHLALECLHTPGHTIGSSCLLTKGHLITGDTLFIKGCGRTDLPGGDTHALYESLCRLTRLQDTCIIYPGHHYAEQPSISLGEEKRTSPLLQQPTFDDFLQLLGGRRRRT